MITTHDDGRLRILTFDRPEALNAFDDAGFRALGSELDRARDDAGVACVLLTGTGRAFTAGMDLKSSGTGLAEGEEPGFLPFARALLAFDKPLLAAVNGIAVGIGTTVLLHCDIVLASPSARFRVPFTRLGVVPEAASSLLLPAAIGWQAAAEWLYTSDWLHAEQAAALGFVLRVVPDAELMTQALHLAQRIAAMPITSLRETKRLMKATRDDSIAAANQREQDAFLTMIGQPANIEGVTAVFERREPDFSKL
ncbi:MAG: enoyl-CoA hydratase-related protein [Acidimicrobiia bacterium]